MSEVIKSATLNGKFRYNGTDLAMMKNLALTTDPHKAVEDFITKAINNGREPNEYLEELRKTYNEVKDGTIKG